MKILNRTIMAKKYAGKWIALKQDRKSVIAAGQSALNVHAKAVKSGVKHPIITHIPRRAGVFVGKIGL